MSYNRTEVEALIQLINSGDIDSLKASEFEHFEYQGFDPLKIVASLLKVKNDKSIGDDDFRKDVYLMVAIGMIKGSVNEHNINKMSDKGKEDVTRLNSRYGIKMGGGRGQSSNVITYPRVMATFPDITVRLVKVVGPKEFRGGPLGSTRLPDYMQVQVFPSVIPKDVGNDAKRMLLTASLCYSIDQSVQISRLQNPDLKQLSDTQMNFTQVGHNSPVAHDDSRKEIFKSLPIKDDLDSILMVLETYKQKVDKSFIILSKQAFRTSLG